MKRMAPTGHWHHNCIKSFIVRNVQFSDDQIIELQHALLTPGFHHLYVADIYEGREILSTFLDLLHCFTDIACLTTTAAPLKLNPLVFNLYEHLLTSGYFDLTYKSDLEDFLLNHFESDFLWIEGLSPLINQPWFSYFEQKLIDLRIDQQIPIMMISYQRE